MLNRTRVFRLGWIFAALFQIVVPTVASVADARAEAASIRVAATGHVESGSRANCPRVHPADCVLCQMLSAAARPERSTPLHVAAERIIVASAERYDRAARSATAPGDPPQRAPPILS